MYRMAIYLNIVPIVIGLVGQECYCRVQLCVCIPTVWVYGCLYIDMCVCGCIYNMAFSSFRCAYTF